MSLDLHKSLFIAQQSLIDSSSDEGLKLDNLVGNVTLEDVHFTYPARPDVKVE